MYIPKTLILEVLTLTHSHKLAGHPGIKKLKTVLNRNYFWPHCAQDEERYVRECFTCNRHKGNVNVRAQLEFYPAELLSFQVVAMDHMGPLLTTLVTLALKSC